MTVLRCPFAGQRWFKEGHKPVLGVPRMSLPMARDGNHHGSVSARDKILSAEQLSPWRNAARAAGRKVVITNGCFDLIHVGHVTYLEMARSHGDILLVGLNGDQSVRELKGPGRPLNPELDRAVVLAALESVGAVFIFPEKRATHFLRLAQPDVYVKGGDYTIETLDQDERRAVEEGRGRIVIIPFVPGKSTTGLIKRMATH